MRNILIALLFVSTTALSDLAHNQCNFIYLGDNELWNGNKVAPLGVETGSYLFTCNGCGVNQINVYPSESTESSYQFYNNGDFIRKTSSDYVKNSIANIEVGALSQGGRVGFSIISVSDASFPVYGSPSAMRGFVQFKARTKTKDDMNISHIGFVTSTGESNCTIVASFIGDNPTPEASKAIDYFMNNSSL